MSQGTWPELDTKLLAREKSLPEGDAPRRQYAAIYTTDANSGEMLEDRWVSDTPIWLSSLTAMPRKNAPTKAVLLAAGVRLDGATGDVVPELYVFSGEELKLGPSLVIRGDSNGRGLPLSFGGSSGVWLPHDCEQ